MIDHSKPTLARGCKLRDGVLQIPEGLIKMSGAGLEIIKMCDGERTTTEIIQALCLKYAAAEPSKIGEETVSFLRRLNERAVILFQ